MFEGGSDPGINKMEKGALTPDLYQYFGLKVAV